MDNTQRPAVLSVEYGHDWAPNNASEQECLQCAAVRPIPDDCTSNSPNQEENCYTIADCYARGHGGGQCPAGWPVVH